MISDGSCDTEEVINYILKYIKIENSYLKL